MVVFLAGLTASVCIVALTFMKTQKSVSLVTIALSLVGALQYFLLGQTTAAGLSGLSLIYALVVYSTVGRGSTVSLALDSNWSKFSLIVVYSAIFGMLNGGFSWDLQLLAYVGSILMVTTMMVSNVWMLKSVLFAAGVCWTVFQVKTGAYGNLVGQAFYFGGLILSSIVLLRSKSKLVRSSELQLRENDLIHA